MEVVKRAKENNVSKMLLPNINVGTYNDMMQMASQFPELCLPMIGLHPTSVNENFHEELRFLEQNIQKNSFVAIGETGIDLYWDKTFKKQQEASFRVQLEWSQKYDLPVVIHARESFEEIFHILEDYNNMGLKGVFHSFTGNLHDVQRIIELGFYFGINGIVTFKNSGLDKIVKDIPLEKILIETDSPFLAPVPYRGKRNESAYVHNIAEKLADVFNISIDEMAEITTENAKKLFKI